MKIFVAGASGAIGLPLIDCLLYDGHDVIGITRSEQKARIICSKGAKAMHLDIMDHEAVMAALQSLRPDVVIDMLTSLPKEYTPKSMQQAAEIDAQTRLTGGANLLAGAVAASAKRYIAQSAAFWYAPGGDIAMETAPFALEASPGIAAGCQLYSEIEKRVLQSSKIDGVALRFGFFYGQGTWFHMDGDVARQVHDRQMPIIGSGQGVWNFIHILDAAKSIASAIYCAPGAYNIVNNRPTRLSEWLPAFARYINAPEPPKLSEDKALSIYGADAVYYATKLRAASNSKAKQAFNFEPRTFEWLLY
jgi:nucleoside-diphosphate-sugar epimerase